MVKVTIDGSVHDAIGNERLIDLLNRIGTKLKWAQTYLDLWERGACM